MTVVTIELSQQTDRISESLTFLEIRHHKNVVIMLSY